MGRGLRELETQIAGIVKELGGEVDGFQYSKHLRVLWRIGDMQIRSSCPLTPSDHRTFMNVKSDLRRAARQAAERKAVSR